MMPPEENQASSSPSESSRSIVDRRFFSSHQQLADRAESTNGAMIDWYGAQAQQPEILGSGLDPMWLIHSFRRRWVMATGLGILVASLLAVLIWWLTPNENIALAQFEVKSERPQIVFPVELGEGIGDYDRYRDTNVQKVTSQYVLQAALRSISTLPAIREEKNQLAWLADRIQVGFLEDSEIMQISMTGDEPMSELREYVTAVSESYHTEVVSESRNERARLLEELKAAEVKIARELQIKRDDYIKQSRILKAGDDQAAKVEQSVIDVEMAHLNERLSKLEAELNYATLDYQRGKRLLNDPAYLDSLDQNRMQNDSYLAALNQQLEFDQWNLAQKRIRGTGRKSSGIKQLEKKIQDTSLLIAEHRAQLKQQYDAQRLTSPDENMRLLRQGYQEHRQHLESQIKSVEDEVDALKEKAKELGARNAELEMMKADIDQTLDLQTELKTKIQQWEIEQTAPPRIDWHQRPTTYTNLESSIRYIIVAVAWLFGFALTGFGIAYLEFQSKRLNDPKQVDEGLGIRVVGSLPALAFRSVGDESDPLLATLTESIDNVRTALMHDSTSARRQVVMVTSATGHEGRTTVASQLAASLARAGRRTLLIDGDLRHPSLHNLFDVSLEDGLCELLRAEAEIDDVVRPTHAEGLWLLTAGFCDVQAVQALAKDQLQPVFDKLRTQYDFIVIDAAPALNLSDALVMGQYVDGVIVSVLRDISKVPQVHEVHELLKSLGIPVFGAVVNGIRSQADVRTERLHLLPPAEIQEESTAEVSTQA